MKKELEQLLNMRKENKISESDFEILSEALTKNSFCSILENSILINPFQKIAGFKALFIGIIIMLLMSILGVYASVYIDGTLGYLTSNGLKVARQPSFFLLLYQNAIACIVVAALFYLSAILLRQKGIRIIDFLGTITFARYPLCISLLFFIIEKWLKPENFNQDLSQGMSLHFSIIGTIGGLLLMACYLWQGMNYFFAFKESSGLDGKRLWSAFLVTMPVADVLAIILTRFFLYS